MRIENLEIRYFGRKSKLFLEDLSPRINVIYGPTGAGKSTAIQFIRWMLFGNCDDFCQRYLRETTGYAEGAMSVFHDGLRRSITKQDDGSRSGQVRFHEQQPFSGQDPYLASLLGDLTHRDFDQLVAPDFAQDLDLYGLLRHSQARGLALSGSRVSNPRVPEIRMRIDNLRRDMDRLPWRASDVQSLVEQKRLLESRISMLEEEQRRRRLDYDREYQEINRQVQEIEQEIARIRQQWHVKDDEVSARRGELEASCRAAEEAKQEFLRRRREELASIEANLGRARAMIGEVRQRYERIDAEVRTHDFESSLVEPPDATACLVNTIARQLDQLRQAPRTSYDAQTGRYHPAAVVDVVPGASNPEAVPRPSSAASAWVGVTQPTLDSLRAEVGQLCRTLQENQSGQRTKQLAIELEQLRQCDQVMENWIENLVQQRDHVAAELEKVQALGVALVADTAQGDVWSHRGTIAGEIAQPERVKAVPHACDAYQPIEPESDVLLRRLTGEREVLHRELESAERRSRQRLDRRRELESAIGRSSDQGLEAARRQLIEIESLVRAGEERQRMHREIEQLEAELRRLQDGFQQSTIIQRASETLRRLSVNRLIAVTVDGLGGVAVEDDAGHVLPCGQLGRGARDQVYLSLVLALASAYRTRGTDLPLILNDVFSHIDSERDDATAAVLNDFAAQGHQVLVFTRHRHVAQLFEPYQARLLELTSVAPMDTPVPAQEIVEAVRFRPQGEDLGTLRSVRTARQVNQAKYERAFPIPSRFAQRPTDVPQQYRDVTLTNDELADPPRSRRKDVAPRRPIVTSPSRVHNPVSSPRPAESSDRSGSHVLSRSTTLEQTGIIDADVISRLRAMSLVTVDDFLNASPASVDRELHSWGLSTRPIRRWQDELQLRCHIPGLSANEARLLVAAGVSDLQILADCESDTLAGRLTTLLSSRAGSGAPNFQIDLAKVATWVTTARRRVTNYRQASPTRLTSPGIVPTTYAESESLSARDRSATRRSDDGPDDDQRPGGDRTPDESGLLGGSSSDEDGNGSGRPRRSRSRRGTRSRDQAATGSDRPTISRRGRSARSQSNRQWKFYLSRRAAVVDAPSIGARTAERLRDIGIHTVEDLLSCDPAEAAAQIDYRRISAATIREWQAQAVLCCRIPLLRAHDAQILVAVGVTDSEELAGMSADELWRIVRPFTKTTECKRIVRNGKTPDADEIRDWIEWAQNARALSVA